MKDGKVVAVSGDRQAEVNKGLLCVKGYHVGHILYGPDRLTTPQLRKNGKLEPITWNEAIETIAKRIQAVPAKFAFYGSGQWTVPEGYAANKFMKGGLSNNHIDPNARLCMASAVTGYISTYGVDEPYNCYDDLDHCDVLILWGNNFAEMHPVLFSRFIDRKLKGDKITLVDLTTRHTRTSERADHVLVFQPQSDLAIANCIAQQVITANAVASEFVEKHCTFRKPWKKPDDSQTLMGEPCTFDEYKQFVAEYTPENVAKTSGLSVEQLQLLGKLFADKSKKITSLWCMGMNQHTQGTAINNLVHAIHLLSGHWGKPATARSRSPASRRRAAPCGRWAPCRTPCPVIYGWTSRTRRRRRRSCGTCRPAASTRRSATTRCRCGRSSAPRPTRGATSTRCGCR